MAAGTRVPFPSRPLKMRSSHAVFSRIEGDKRYAAKIRVFSEDVLSYHGSEREWHFVCAKVGFWWPKESRGLIHEGEYSFHFVSEGVAPRVNSDAWCLFDTSKKISHAKHYRFVSRGGVVRVRGDAVCFSHALFDFHYQVNGVPDVCLHFDEVYLGVGGKDEDAWGGLLLDGVQRDGADADSLASHDGPPSGAVR